MDDTIIIKERDELMNVLLNEISNLNTTIGHNDNVIQELTKIINISNQDFDDIITKHIISNSNRSNDDLYKDISNDIISNYNKKFELYTQV